jgi:hypothetical protein
MPRISFKLRSLSIANGIGPGKVQPRSIVGRGLTAGPGFAKSRKAVTIEAGKGARRIRWKKERR